MRYNPQFEEEHYQRKRRRQGLNPEIRIIINIMSRTLRVTPGDDKQELPRVYWPWQLLFVIARSETKISVYDIDYSLISGFNLILVVASSSDNAPLRNERTFARTYTLILNTYFS